MAFAGLDKAEGHGYIVPVPVIAVFRAHYRTTGSGRYAAEGRMLCCRADLSSEMHPGRVETICSLLTSMHMACMQCRYGMLPDLGVFTRDLTNPALRKYSFGGTCWYTCTRVCMRCPAIQPYSHTLRSRRHERAALVDRHIYMYPSSMSS